MCIVLCSIVFSVLDGIVLFIVLYCIALYFRYCFLGILWYCNVFNCMHCIGSHCIVLHCIVLYGIVLYCIALYCILLFCRCSFVLYYPVLFVFYCIGLN